MRGLHFQVGPEVVLRYGALVSPFFAECAASKARFVCGQYHSWRTDPWRTRLLGLSPRVRLISMPLDAKPGRIAPSPATLKALRILADWAKTHSHDECISPKRFARLMWPDSPGWRSSTKCGNNGVTLGGAMPQAGGTLLGRLERMGFTDFRHRINENGLRVLSASGESSN